MVEGNSADVVVKNMGLDDTVEKLTADEAKLAIDRCSGTTNIVPASSSVVRKSRVSVLEEGDSDYI